MYFVLRALLADEIIGQNEKEIASQDDELSASHDIGTQSCGVN